MLQRGLAPSIGGVLFAIMGCADGAANRPAVLLRDSAGITIVENPGFSPEGGVPVWLVDSIPAVSIGGAEFGPQYDLNRVREAVRLSDGRMIVADGESSELRMFDSTGRFVRRIGRKGRGPGEFEQLGSIWLSAADTLAVYDFATRRLTLFDSAGQLAGQMDIGRLGYLSPVGRLDDGTLVCHGIVFDTSRATSGPARRQPLPILLVPFDASRADTLVVVPGWEMYPVEGREGGQTFPGQMGVEFGHSTTIKTLGNSIYVGDNARYEVAVYSPDRRLVRLIRSSEPAVPVSEVDRRAQEAANLAGLSQWRGASAEMIAYAQQQAKAAQYADYHPYFDDILFAADGEMWVQDARRPGDEQRRFTVFDASGRMIGRVTLPPRVRPFQVERNLVLGLWRDADDVQYVRLYRFQRP